MTHYLAPFVDRPDRWGYQGSVCGARILAKDHSTEPVCTICKGWLLEDAEGLLTLQGLTAADFPPAPPARVFGDFDPTRDLPTQDRR